METPDSGSPLPPPPDGSWQPDPSGRHQWRWRRHSGDWSDSVADGSEVGTDPFSSGSDEPDRHPQPARQPQPIAPSGDADFVSADGSRAKPPVWRRWWAIAIYVLVAFAVLGSLLDGGGEAPDGGAQSTRNQDSERGPLTAEEAFEDCVSPWDGNHNGFEQLIRERLNDPGSMETHGTFYNPSDSVADGTIRIRLNYGARNSFGGMVRNDAIGEMNVRTCEVSIVTLGG